MHLMSAPYYSRSILSPLDEMTQVAAQSDKKLQYIIRNVYSVHTQCSAGKSKHWVEITEALSVKFLHCFGEAVMLENCFLPAETQRGAP